MQAKVVWLLGIVSKERVGGILMTVDQLIAAVSSVGTFATAIATYRTVTELSKQREETSRQRLEMESARRASYRPEVIPLSASLFGGRDNDRSSIKLASWSTGQNAEATFIFFRLENVGIGAARNVKVVMSSNYEAFVRAFNKLAELLPDSDRLTFAGKEILSKKKAFTANFFHDTDTRELPYILPASYKTAETLIQIPYAFEELLSTYCRAYAEAEKLVQYSVLSHVERPPYLSVRLSYEDSGGEVHSANFDIFFTLHGFQSISACFMITMQVRKTQI